MIGDPRRGNKAAWRRAGKRGGLWREDGRRRGRSEKYAERLRPEAFEPPTAASEAQCSVQLTYGRLTVGRDYPTGLGRSRPTQRRAASGRLRTAKGRHGRAAPGPRRPGCVRDGHFLHSWRRRPRPRARSRQPAVGAAKIAKILAI